MADDLDGTAADAADNPSPAPAPAPAPAPTPTPAPSPAPAPKPATIVAGGDGAQPAPAPKNEPAWPENWRELMAGGDAKELKRLQRMTDPRAVYGSYREMEARFGQGGLVKVPGPKATPEEKAAFYKATGVPDKPEAYFEKLSLSDGKVLGEADKPIADAFVKAMHPVGAPPEVVSAAVDFWLNHQEQQAAQQYDQDIAYKNEGTEALRSEWGPSFATNVNAIPTIFAKAPGGADPNNENGLMFRILNGRMADGKIVGNDPDALRWLASMALEVNPYATVVPATADQAKAASDRLAELRKLSGQQTSEYWVGPKSKVLQEEFQKLLDAEQKMKARGAA